MRHALDRLHGLLVRCMQCRLFDVAEFHCYWRRMVNGPAPETRALFSMRIGGSGHVQAMGSLLDQL